MLDCVNGCIATFKVVVGPCYNLTMKKVDEHMKRCHSSLTQRFISHYTFLSSRREKEREYESWVDYVSSIKRNNVSWGERESRIRPRIFLLVFYCSFNVFVGWFRLHKFATDVRPFFGAHPQNGGRNFRLFLRFRSWCPTHVSTFSCLATNFPTRVHRLLLPGVGERTISVLNGSTPMQKIWDLWVF